MFFPEATTQYNRKVPNVSGSRNSSTPNQRIIIVRRFLKMVVLRTYRRGGPHYILPDLCFEESISQIAC